MTQEKQVGNFYFEMYRRNKDLKKNKKNQGKKRLPQFLLCMYVFCLSVVAVQTSSFNLGG